MSLKKTASGLECLLAGYGLLLQPGIKRFVIIPIMVNFLFFIGLFFTLKFFVGELDAWVLAQLPTWLQWLGHIVWLMFFLGFFIIFLYAFVALANIVAAPFNSLLAERVELHLTGQALPAKSMLENMRDVPRSISRQISIVLYFIPRAMVCFVLFFIPVVNLIAAPVWFLFSAWFMAMQYVDFPTENHHVSFVEVRQWLGERKWAVLGLGSSILVAMMIPGLNLVTMPAAVAAATKFWVQERQG